MNYYVLAGADRHPAVKAGYRFVDLLNGLGARSVAVTPDGTAPEWFRSSAPTMPMAEATDRLTADDAVLFSTPELHRSLAALPARLVLHCNEFERSLHSVAADPAVTLLAASPGTAAAVRDRTGREAIDVGRAVADVFFHAGSAKQSATLATAEESQVAALAAGGMRLVPLAGLDEQAVARTLQSCEAYLDLATSPTAGRDMSVLEPLAAGCAVFATPSSRDADVVSDGVDGVVADATDLVGVLHEWTARAARGRRAALADRGRVTAAAFRPDVQRRRVAALLGGPLAFLLT